MRKALVILLLVMALPCGRSFASSETSSANNYQQANGLLASKRYQEAIPLFKSTLANPLQKVPVSDVYTRIGHSYYGLGLYQNAIEAYQAALSGQDREAQPGTRYWIGFCYFLLGQDEQATREFLLIPELYPTAGMWVGTAYYWAGRSCERRGLKNKAAEYYKKAGGKGKSTQGRFAIKKAEEVKRR